MWIMDRVEHQEPLFWNEFIIFMKSVGYDNETLRKYRSTKYRALVKKMYVEQQNRLKSTSRHYNPAVEVDTSYYEFNTGKRPSGFGSWAFVFNKKTYKNVNEVFWVHGKTYSEAKKIAIEEAKRRGAHYVSVQP